MGKIFSIILCLQLIIFPLTSFGEDAPDTGSRDQPTAEQAALAQEFEDQVRTENTEGASAWIKQIVMMVTSCTGSTMMISCPRGFMLPSIYAFVAGAGSFVAAELQGSSDLATERARASQLLNSTTETNTFNYDAINSMVGNRSLQLETINAAILTQQSLLKYAEAKLTAYWWMIGFYWGSVALAVAEGFNVFDGGGAAGCMGTDFGASQGIATVLFTFGFGVGNLASSTSDEEAKKKMLSFVGSMVALAISAKVAEFGYYQWGWTRVITFGALAVLGSWLVYDMFQKIDAIKQNIADLEKIKASFPSGEGDKPNDFTLTDYTGNQPDPKKYSNNGPKEQDTKKFCFDSKMQFGPDCSNPMKFTPPAMSGDFDIPVLKDFMSNATNMANASASGDGAAASVYGGKIANSASSLRNLAKKAIKKYNEHQKKQGKPELDFDKEVKKRVLEFASDYKKQFNAHPNILASLNPKAGLPDAKPKELKNKIGPLEKSETKANSTSPKDLLAGLDTGDENPVEIKKETPTLEQSLNEFETTESDINKTKDVSLFAILSNRYVLSYGRIMNQKKPKEEIQKVETKP